MKIEIPEVNVEDALLLCDGNTDIYLNILRAYVGDVKNSLTRMRNVTRESLQDYTISVHSIKSISAAIGAEKASITAKQLEDLSKARELEGVLARNSAFVKYMENLVNNVQICLTEHGITEINAG